MVILYTFLLLLYRQLVVRFLLKSFKDHTKTVHHILAETRYIIKSYLAGLIIEMIIVACLNCVAFLLLGVKYALLLGVISALLNLIPYLGIFIACILSMLVTFTTNSAGTVVSVGIVLLSVHLVDANILLPKIVGSRVKMNALATIFGVVVGSAIWGIPGMFLAIPIVAILKVIFENVESLESWCILLGDDVAVKSSAQHSYESLTRPLRKKWGRKA
jgi:predicted PurR-regulated permease PerM